ncbi:MAG: SRPBCC domain-containing protein [Bacteroidetes bacterium]|nr:MAG: SRPBCC domain-containing protein [Bacteroidota bacterium]
MENKIANEFTIIRMFDAAPELVWKAWTDPEQYKKWWGPKNFTCPFSKIDLKVGGKYLSCMRSPEGMEFWTTGIFKEIIPMKRIVYTDCFADENGNEVPASHYGMPGDWPSELIVKITLEEINGKTKMTLSHTGIPEGEMSENTVIGWNESFDKLVESLK